LCPTQRTALISSDFGILDGGQIQKPSNPKCSISVTEILENF